MWHTRPYKIFPWPLFHFFLTCPCTPTCGVFIQSSIVFPQCTMLCFCNYCSLCVECLPFHFSASSRNWQLYDKCENQNAVQENFLDWLYPAITLQLPLAALNLKCPYILLASLLYSVLYLWLVDSLLYKFFSPHPPFHLLCHSLFTYFLAQCK